MPSPNWRDLFDLGVAFRSLAPWKWMQDTDVFGVRDPNSDRIGWCVVLGSAGELEGLSVYLGDSGFDTYRTIQEQQAIALDQFWGQDALVLLFGDREEVSSRQRAMIKELGLKFRGRGAWPAFTEHRVGYMPRDMPPEQVPFTIECIRQCLVVAARIRTDPEYAWPDDQDQLVVVTGDQVERVAEPPPVPEPPVPQANQVDLGHVRARCRRSDTALEVGVFPFAGTAVDGPEGPYVPALALVVDAGTGMVLGTNLGERTQRDLIAQQLLVKTIGETGVIPRAVLVADSRTARVLAPIAQGLDVALQVAERLPMIDEAREAMVGFFGAR